jgi:hypothetical protein
MTAIESWNGNTRLPSQDNDRLSKHRRDYFDTQKAMTADGNIFKQPSAGLNSS